MNKAPRRGWGCWGDCGLLACAAVLAWSGIGQSQEPSPPAPVTPVSKAVARPRQLAVNEGTTSAETLASPMEPSLAEQITRLEKSMQVDEQRLTQMRAELVDPMSEYRLAEAAYKQVDEQVAALKLELEARPMGEAAAILTKMLEELTTKHALARERFDLAIDSRKTRQEQIAALEAKLKQDRQALDKMTGTTPALPAEAPVAAAPAAAPPPSEPSPAAGALADAGAAAAGAAPAALTPAKTPSKELVKAGSEAQQKRDQAVLAEQDARSVSDRIAALDRDIELENKQLIATRRKSDIAYQAAQELESEKERLRQQPGAKEQDLRDVRERRRAAEQHFQAARLEVAAHIDQLNALQSQRAALQREELAALSAAAEKQRAADDAEALVSRLKNPFSAQNLLQWLLDHGPQLGVILVAMLVLRWLVSLASMRVVNLMIMRGARGTLQEREDRANTLVAVFRNAVSLTIVVSGVLMICEEIGIAVGPLMGGAAVLGLAAAFGAQNLIRDYFYGFVILLENQYKLNDVLRIGDIAGQVEQITLRMTVLRDLEGNVHFIPNGKIDSVTNMTHGWARAVIDVDVAYGEDADRVMSVVLEVAAELQQDPAFRGSIIDDAEMLGVERLGESSLTIRCLIKTRPLRKWPVKREMLRRIKRRFDELGIQIPFPQRVVHHRYDSAGETIASLPVEPFRPRSKSA